MGYFPARVMSAPWKSLAGLSLVLGSCTLGTGIFAGKTCKSNVDCPDPYVCAQVRTEGRTCELVRGVETFDPSSDNPAYYCNGPDGGGGVKNVLDKHCVSNCHGTDMSYPGTPRNFRLDVYSTGTALPGAFAKAAALNKRAQDDTMPPPGLMGYSRCSTEDKNLLLRWINAGAPECAGTDDGGSGDGGSGDGGSGDGGMMMTGDGGMRPDGGDGG